MILPRWIYSSSIWYSIFLGRQITFLLTCRAEGDWRASCVWVSSRWIWALGSWLCHRCKVTSCSSISFTTLSLSWFYVFQVKSLIHYVSCVRYVMSPPIRSSGHDKALQAALSTGVLQVIITKKMKHLPYCRWKFLTNQFSNAIIQISEGNYLQLQFWFLIVNVCIMCELFMKN